jgi:hypothetical protein
VFRSCVVKHAVTRFNGQSTAVVLFTKGDALSWVEQHEEPWYQENEGGLTEPKEHTESETESADTEDDGI